MLIDDRPQTLDEAMLAGWSRLVAYCPACRVWRVLPVDTLERHGGSRLDRIAGRLRCHRCGGRPSFVHLERHSATGGITTGRIDLAGGSPTG